MKNFYINTTFQRTELGVHVYTKCTQDLQLFKNDKAKLTFMDIVNDAVEKFDFELHSYVILDNHYHIFFTPKNDPQLPKIMQYINYRLSRWLNKFHGRSGNAFQSRYRKKFVADVDFPDQYSKWLIVYFGTNPCRCGIVSKPEQYLYSSYNAYIDKEYRSLIKISYHKSYLKMGYNFSSRRKALLELQQNYKKILYSY